MSEHNYPAPPPSEEYPGDKSANEPDQPIFITPEEAERAKSSRYREEAVQLYFANIQQDPEVTAAKDLKPLTESWLSFETSYAGSFESMIEFVDQTIDDLGWFRIIHKMATQMGIPAGALRLDYADVYDYICRYFQVFSTDEGVLHVFTRPGIKPMAPDATSRGGAAR